MARRRSSALAAARHQRLVLDAGAIIGLSRADQRARAALAAAHEVGAELVVPAVVVAEVVRGGPEDAPVNRVLSAVGAPTPADEVIARVAGALLGATGSRSTADALVVATAVVAGGGVVLTGDPDDLARLAAGHSEVVVRAL